MDFPSFLKQVSHIVNIDTYKTFGRIENIHNVTFYLFTFCMKRNLFVNEVENWFQFFSLYTILLFHMYQSAISYTIKPIFIIKCHISIP